MFITWFTVPVILTVYKKLYYFIIYRFYRLLHVLQIETFFSTHFPQTYFLQTPQFVVVLLLLQCPIWHHLCTGRGFCVAGR